MDSQTPQDKITQNTHRILVIDDEPLIGASIHRALAPAGHDVENYSSSQQGLEAALTDLYDVIFLDLKMPDVDGMEVLKRIKAAGVLSEIVIITGYSTVETAVEAMQHGAADFLAKPFTPSQLNMVLQKVGERSALIRENAALRKELEVDQGFEGIIGESPAMQRIFSLIKRVAVTDGTVMITGESGTGKEMVVRAIHRLSRRKDHNLIACDCSALAPTLLETELFGHVKGSFSGAIATKEGLFEAAHKGTLFLDEISNLGMETQGKLLRALESRRIKKVGDTVEREVDIRLITASNRDISTLVEKGIFREDLYYRLNVVPVNLPPLREREGDIPLIATSFLSRFCKKSQINIKHFTPEAMAKIESYEWPGNVRELRNIIERIAILCESDMVQTQHLPPEIRQTSVQTKPSELPGTWKQFKVLKQQIRDKTVQDLQRRFLLEALERNNGNITKAAKDVGMQRSNFHALLRRCETTSETA